jgi:hypothetical protein
MQFDSLQAYQEHLRSFSDPNEREIAEISVFLGTRVQPSPRKHIVVLLHGMNTNAEWQEALAEPMRTETELEPKVVGYGNFHPLKFWSPFFFREGRVRKVLADLRGLRERNPDANISIVAHSFGTHIVAKIVRMASDLKFHRILLCGSIVASDYNWARVGSRFNEPVVNDIGRRDIWPSMAKSCTWGLGDSGCIGFQNSLVRDRHFTYGHSGFLNVHHMRQFWLPYLLDGRVITPRFNLKRKPMGLRERIYRGFPYKYIIVLIVGLLTTGIVWGLARGIRAALVAISAG